MTADIDQPRTPMALGVKVAIGFVAVLAVLAVVLAIPRSQPDTATPAPGTAAQDAEAPVTPQPDQIGQLDQPTANDNAAEGDEDSICGLSAGSQAVPVQPPEVEWELVGAIAVPADPAIGPGLLEDGLRRCYAHNPTGALFGGINFIAQANMSDTPEAAAQTIRELAARGPGRDLALQVVQEEPAGGSGDDPPLAVAGYSFFNYSENLTTFDVLFQAGVDGFVRIPVTMRWEDGDWRYQIAGTGEPFDGLEALSSAAGHTRWGP